MGNVELLYPEECYAVQGAVFEVYRQMGCGFLEHVYQECLGLEFAARKIPFAVKPKIALSYKGQQLLQTYSPDFVVYEAIILELKALTQTTSQHQAQVLNYLKGTGFRLGLLVNFGSFPKATVERLVL